MSVIDVGGYRPAHLSWSSFDSWRSCGMKFRLQKVEQREQRPGWSSIGGSAVHAVIEGIEVGAEHPDGLEAWFSEEFAKHLEKTKERSPNYGPEQYHVADRGRKDAAWWLVEGPKMCQRWIDWRNETKWTLWETPSGVPGVELECNFSLPGDIPIKGFIDNVWVLPTGELAVGDTKTGRTPEYPEQLGLYATALEILYGVRPTWGYFWDANKGSHGQPLDLSLYTAEYLADEFAQMIAGANAGVFLAKPQMGCAKWCGVASNCPAVGGSNDTGSLLQQNA